MLLSIGIYIGYIDPVLSGPRPVGEAAFFVHTVITGAVCICTYKQGECRPVVTHYRQEALGLNPIYTYIYMEHSDNIVCGYTYISCTSGVGHRALPSETYG